MTTKKIRLMPAQLVLGFANSDHTVVALPEGINPLSYRLAVTRYNEGAETASRSEIWLVRRTDIQTNQYLLVRT